MSIAEILVPATGTTRDEVAIAVAMQLAKSFNAHVVVQFVHPDPAGAVPLLGVPLSTEAMQAIIDGQTQFAQAAAARASETLSSLARRSGLEIARPQALPVVATCSFRKLWGDTARLIADAARLSDLVVFGPVRWRDSPEINEAFLDVLRTVRRPVLVANQIRGSYLGKIAIGWDGSAFAAHAICGAMPFLRRAELVTILEVRPKDATETSDSDLVEYLSRNQVKFERRTIAATHMTPAETLLSEAGAAGAEMLVAGGYGHDHLWETFFGGVTDTLLAKAKIPVLFAR